MTATLITCSFRGDLDICRLLCRSIDFYAGPDFEHRVYVPRRDLPLFAALATPRRRILTQESLLPPWFFKLPMPPSPWRERLRLPRRNLYLTPRPVRGWIAQQIMKISASLQAPGDVIAHIDSDAALIRPLNYESLRRGEATRFYAGPVAKRLPGHALWYRAARRLLGVPDIECYEADYIAPLVVWRRAVVEAMTRRIASATGRSWARALAATPHFSEYVLYGVFAERALGLEAAGLWLDHSARCLTRWTQGFSSNESIGRFVADVGPEDLVCCVQSTLDVDIAVRARVYGRAARAVAALRLGARGLAA